MRIGCCDNQGWKNYVIYYCCYVHGNAFTCMMYFAICMYTGIAKQDTGVNIYPCFHYNIIVSCETFVEINLIFRLVLFSRDHASLVSLCFNYP